MRRREEERLEKTEMRMLRWILGLTLRDVGGQRSRGRQRKRWIDVVKHNMEDLQLNVEDAKNRVEWRKRTRVADPSPEGSTA